jgi:hypothetical protein
LQDTVHRAFVGNRQQFAALFACQIAGESDGARDSIDLAMSVDLDPVVHQFDADTGEWQVLAFGVHAQGDRGTGAEAGKQEIEGRRASIATAHGDGFIGNQAMPAGIHHLLVGSQPILADDDRMIVRLTVLVLGHALISRSSET